MLGLSYLALFRNKQICFVIKIITKLVKKLDKSYTRKLMKVFTILSIFLFCLSPLKGQGTQSKADQELAALLARSVNTDLAEVRPLISPDGRTLYFCRRFSPNNVRGTKDFQDVWVSHMNEKGEWSDPANLGVTVNDKHANAICAISPDGQTAIFYNTYEKVSNPLARSKFVNNQWTRPAPITIENFYNHSQFSDFYVCFTNNILFMSVERDDTRGDQDLYISFMDEYGHCQEPINLGDNINSVGADFAPFLAPDGRSLFFASFGHRGNGGSDIYVSHRLDDTWTKWSNPVNLGPLVNSKDNEVYFSLTGDFRYLYLDRLNPMEDKRDITVMMVPDEIRPRQFQEATQAPKMSYGSDMDDMIVSAAHRKY